MAIIFKRKLNMDENIINNGYIMCKDEKVAVIHNGKLKILDDKRCPVLLKRTKSISAWLEDRVCDSDRKNIKILKNKLGFEDKSNISMAIYNNALNLTDMFWFKPLKCKNKYENMREFENNYCLFALNNIQNYFEKDKFTYEFTNIGAMEKCWNYQNGQWHLLKNGTKKEVISEFTASRVGELLGINVVHYEKNRIVCGEKKFLKSEFSTCLNFTSENTYFESMYAYIGDDEDYRITIDMLKILEKENNCSLVYDYINMLALDYIVYNVDRHTHNYGILKNFADGKVIGMAPAFDFNMCLTANNCVLKERSPQFMFKFLAQAVQYSKIHFELKEVKFNNFECEDKIKEFIINNYNYLTCALI